MSESKVHLLNIGPIARRLDVGGEPPDNGAMEARIAKIETRLDQVDDRLTRVEVKLDHIDKEVSNFKWWVIAQIAAGLLAGESGIPRMTGCAEWFGNAARSMK